MIRPLCGTFCDLVWLFSFSIHVIECSPRGGRCASLLVKLMADGPKQFLLLCLTPVFMHGGNQE